MPSINAAPVNWAVPTAAPVDPPLATAHEGRLSEDHARPLEGVLQGVLYHNDAGWAVLVLRDQHGIRHRATGVMPNPIVGEALTLKGRWSPHPPYGRVFEFHDYVGKPPTSISGLVEYIQRSTDLNEEKARQIVKHFGSDALQVLDCHPDRLTEIPGFDETAAERVRLHWQSSKSLDTIKHRLEQVGIDSGKLKYLERVLGRGADLQETLQHDPYLLYLHFQDIPFRIIHEQLARTFEVPADSIAVLRGAIFYLLRRNAVNGHTYMPISELPGKLTKLLRQQLTLESPRLNEALDALKPQFVLSTEAPDGEQRLHLTRLFHAEADIETHLQRLGARESNFDISIPAPTLRKLIHDHLGRDLPEDLRQAFEHLLVHKLLVVDCPDPQLRETFLHLTANVFSRVRARVAISGESVDQCAFHRQALAPFDGIHVDTIHQLLGLNSAGIPLYHANHRLDYDAVLIDQAQMLDIEKFVNLVDALDDNTVLILFGNRHELEPIGPGYPYLDLMRTGRLPLLDLDKAAQLQPGSVLAQALVDCARRQPIAWPAELELSKPLGLLDCRLEELESVLIQLFKNVYPQMGYQLPQDVQVLSPTNRVTGKDEQSKTLTLKDLNHTLQEALFPLETKQRIHGERYCRGDKIIMTRPHYQAGLPAGTFALIREFAPNMQVDIQTPLGAANLRHMDFPDVQLGYISTVHRSRGMRTRVVVLILMESQHFMVTQRLISSALAIAADQVLVIGDTHLVQGVITRKTTGPRRTTLAETFSQPDANAFTR